jgi:hypothetical protein
MDLHADGSDQRGPYRNGKQGKDHLGQNAAVHLEEDGPFGVFLNITGTSLKQSQQTHFTKLLRQARTLTYKIVVDVQRSVFAAEGIRGMYTRGGYGCDFVQWLPVRVNDGLPVSVEALDCLLVRDGCRGRRSGAGGGSSSWGAAGTCGAVTTIVAHV